MTAKKTSTLHRCIEFTKCPRDEVCHQATPPMASSTPVPTTTSSDASARTPKT